MTDTNNCDSCNNCGGEKNYKTIKDKSFRIVEENGRRSLIKCSDSKQSMDVVSNRKRKTLPSYPPPNATEDDLYDITKIFMIVTRNCNLRCKYCFVEQETVNISLETAIDIVHYIAKNAEKYGEVPSINFFGGEPLLRWKDIIVPLTMYIRGKYEKFQLSMTTNGLLLDKEKLEFMKKYKIGILFSMDGDRCTQDLNRPTKNGKSSFEILDNKIPLILDYFPNLTFRSTTDHDNVKEYFNNHKYAIEKGFNNVFNIVNVFSEWSDEEKRELKHQINLLGEYYFNLLKKGKKIRFSPLDTMFKKLKYIEEAEQKNYYRNKGKNFLGYGRCGIGAGRSASVGTDGTLYSCQEMVGNREKGKIFIMGDIYNGVDNRARLDLINQFSPQKVMSTDGKNSCNTCILNNVCDGACLINNYFVTGDLNIMPSILCFYYQTLLYKAKEILEKMKEDKANYKFYQQMGVL